MPPLLMGVLALFLAACTASPHERGPDSFDERVRSLGLDPAALANPVEVDEHIKKFAREAAGPGTPRDQLARLQLALFDKDQFPFEYVAGETLTAIEAFEQRRGDCVSFTNLFIALGRSISIPLKAALVFYGETESEGELVIVNTHIVSILMDAHGSTFYDFAQSRERAPSQLRILDDLWIRAIYLNNRGVAELRNAHLEEARIFLETAILLAPEFIAPYGNLGVALRKLGDIESAYSTYSRALEIEDRDPTILNNLARLYQEQGQFEKANIALKAADLSGASPFLVIARGDLERSQGRYKAALKLYKRALRLDPSLAVAEVAIARLELDRNDRPAAMRALEKALEIDASSTEALQLKSELSRKQ